MKTLVREYAQRVFLWSWGQEEQRLLDRKDTETQIRSLTASAGNSRSQGVIHGKAASFSNPAIAAATSKLLLVPNRHVWEEGSGLFMPNQFRSLCSQIPKQELKNKQVFMCFAEWGWNIPPLLTGSAESGPHCLTELWCKVAWHLHEGSPVRLLC